MSGIWSIEKIRSRDSSFLKQFTEQLCDPTSLLADEDKKTLSYGPKAPGVKLTHSTKLNNQCASTSTPKYLFVARCLVMNRANFTLLVFLYL
jgi:hypothetical protein